MKNCGSSIFAVFKCRHIILKNEMCYAFFLEYYGINVDFILNNMFCLDYTQEYLHKTSIRKL